MLSRQLWLLTTTERHVTVEEVLFSSLSPGWSGSNCFSVWKCPFSLVAISYQTKGILELLQLTRCACVLAYIMGVISFLADASLF
jgi:hypothetical protein